eukprot:7388153-Prymnesium_polylepis.1
MAWRASMRRALVASLAALPAPEERGRSPSPRSMFSARSRSCAALTASTGRGGGSGSVAAADDAAGAYRSGAAAMSSAGPYGGCTSSSWRRTRRRSSAVLVWTSWTGICAASGLP